jgi:hypothetical protein
MEIAVSHTVSPQDEIVQLSLRAMRSLPGHTPLKDLAAIRVFLDIEQRHPDVQ